jgi:gliding motility-associated-like protein
VITVTEPAAMNATTSNINSNCGASDGSVSVTVTGGTGTYSYLWSNSATSAIVNNVPSGGYTVTITDANGCTLTAAAAVSDIGAPSVTAVVTNVLCNGGTDGTATSTVTAGIMPYTYTWSNNDTTPNLANVPAGTYILTVTAANGCKATTSVTIIEPTAITLSTTKTDESCSYSNGTATVTPGGGTSPYVYSWSSGSTNPTAPNLAAGTYTVTVTDNNGCTKTITESVVNIPGPTADFSKPDKCVNDPVPFTNLSSPTATTHTWDFGDAANSTLTSPTHTYTTPGTYTVWLTVSDAGGCRDSISKTVTIYALPIVAFLDTASGCSPLIVNFINQSDSASGTSYVWRFGDGSNPSGVKDPSHLYTNSTQNTLQFSVSLVVISPQGCIDSLTRTNIITVYPNPIAGFTMDPTTTEILAPTISFFDQSLGATSWYWDFGDNTTSTDKDPKHTYSDTGTYNVCLTITNNYGCADRICAPVIIKPIWTFYIPNAFTPDEDGVNDRFGGVGYGILQYELYIFDRWGDLIFKSNSMTTQWDGKSNGGADYAQEDVYVYLVIIRDVFGAKHRYTGSVTLVR